MDLASGVGGKIEKSQILSAVEKYEKYHVCYGGQEEERKANYTDMVNKYYDLSTSFYEFGWGPSFHFAHRWKGESLQESIKRHEHFLALQLVLKPGQKVLDVGCGIGGPLREIARFSSTSALDRMAGVDKTCNYVKADFMKMPFTDNSFDAVYAAEATCHAPDACGCYKGIFRVLKPGQYFAAYEWCMTDVFDPNNEEHQKLKAQIEIGDGLPDIRLTTQCAEALKQAGFEVIWEKDLAIDSPVPWYFPLDTSHFSLNSFRLTAVGRFFTRNSVGTGVKAFAVRTKEKGTTCNHYRKTGHDSTIKSAGHELGWGNSYVGGGRGQNARANAAQTKGMERQQTTTITENTQSRRN
ncbi:unnamed protein product [Sphenostylis stenocarpa]|uniref:SAM-dependent methyltransferase Erg6/SMT-type domain-containing protein n=1 Tax=Sphenostylis stenocarpa TaxID=92480 RepID=A0AA86RY23_9FABA|nr:unnamed protein product [Sphenostylis stenocarpa]